MFTGIVQDIGSLLKRTPHGRGARLTIKTRLPMQEVKLGDSIAVCGACLTVVRKDDGLFEADISRETADRSILATLPNGAPLHLERAMRLDERLDGHLVLGHVDAVGTVRTREEQNDSLYLEITCPDSITRYLVEKGSICVHGVSLTVNRVLDHGFSIQIVPYTRKVTMLDQLTSGQSVNLEADLIGKYVERLLGGRQGRAAGGNVDLALLARAGYLDNI